MGKEIIILDNGIELSVNRDGSYQIPEEVYKSLTKSDKIELAFKILNLRSSPNSAMNKMK